MATRADSGASHGPWLVVGLGNPGPGYAKTRHNAGYLVADQLVARTGGRYGAHRGRADVAETVLAASGGAAPARLVVAKPRSYMNESGGAVASVRDYFRIPMERVVVVHDDLDLPFGSVRLKRGGGAGGHNGLRSVTASLGSPEYLRVRLGIGRPPGATDPAAFVLRPFTGAEARDFPVTVEHAADAVEELIRAGLEAAQNRFHAEP